MATPPHTALSADTSAWRWGVLLLLAVACYLFGLGGQNIPSNGDEMVYAHIARLTALSRHWLPLQSELENMRNTKPPLLFWQAMVAGNWGGHWTLAALRAPSVLYTLAVCAAIIYSMRLWTRQWAPALLAGCIYLAFFSTFRYGRPYLTSAAESFWFGLPMFWLLWQRLRERDAAAPPGTTPYALLVHLLFGVAWGLGLAYKSFALIAPAAAAWWCAALASQPQLNLRHALKTTLWTAFSGAIALGIFALWFVLDPDPGAVWKEFVVGENAGKLAGGEGYWHAALHGGSSIWAQLLAYVQNAGLLLLVVLGLLWAGIQAWRRPGPRTADAPLQWALLAWLGVWLLVFTIPSQRSARYVIPAMPALALLLALHWQRIARAWFWLTLLPCAIALLILGRIAWAAHDVQLGSGPGFVLSMGFAAVGVAAIVAALAKPAWARAGALVACLSVFAVLDGALAPLDGPDGRYDAVQLRGASVAVPNGFNGSFERYQFLLPGNRFVPYDVGQRAASRSTGVAQQPASPREELLALLHTHGAVAWEQAGPQDLQPPCLPDCRLLGTRWYFKGRHQSGEITLANIWYPDQWLFRREWLVAPNGS